MQSQSFQNLLSMTPIDGTWVKKYGFYAKLMSFWDVHFWYGNVLKSIYFSNF